MKQKVLQKIPEKVIRNAKGLAIFTTMRTGLWMSGSGGSGVLIARLPDGSWSCPSGILMHTAGLGFMVGIDIYDCVVVINNEKALEAFTKVRCTLGAEISVAAGPVGAGGVLDTEVHRRQAPIYSEHLQRPNERDGQLIRCSIFKEQRLLCRRSDRRNHRLGAYGRE